MPASEGQHVVITVLNCRLYVLSVLCASLQSLEYGWCLPAPGTEVIASVTLFQHVIAEIEMYGRAMHKILCQWIWNCFKCCCKKQKRGGKLLSAERLSLLAGLVDTQWFTVFGSARSFLTLTNACVMEAGPYSYCSTL